ncbi:MAG: substrate-binding domain-containing protein [Clostridia bacterium]|nr:substrate-binding domain-containing protein [Clostridia bacterium]
MLTPTVESTSVQFIIHAVMSGSGVSILPECLVQREVEDGCLAVRPIRDPGLIKDTFVVWRKDHYMTAAMRRTLEILREMKEQKLL